jgi:hypothetical protein
MTVPDGSDHGGVTPCAARPHGCPMGTWGVQVDSHGHKSSDASDHKAQRKPLDKKAYIAKDLGTRILQWRERRAHTTCSMKRSRGSSRVLSLRARLNDSRLNAGSRGMASTAFCGRRPKAADDGRVGEVEVRACARSRSW